MTLRLFLGLPVAGVFADVPRLDALFPAGGRSGSSFTLTTVGKVGSDDRLWTDAPGVSFMPTGQKQEWQVTISAQTPPGFYLVRAVNQDGCSEPKLLSVGGFDTLVEKEPNDELGKGKAVPTLPVSVNGRLDKRGDVDGYEVELKAGQTLVGLIEAYSLGSAVDMLVHIIDDKGVRLFTASDGRNLDPAFVFKASHAGRFTIQLAGFAHPPAADVQFTGGPAVVYRLHLTSGPTVTHIYPPALMSKGKMDVLLEGYGLDAAKQKHNLKPTEIRQAGEFALLSLPGALLPTQALITRQAPGVEKEPNDTREQAMAMTVGVVGGRIQEKGDVDRFAVTMKKGQKLQARLFAKRLGFPLDATLTVEGPDGKVLTTSDDVSELNRDPRLIWTAAADGVYQIVIEDLMHTGSAQHVYALEIGEPTPAFLADLVDIKPLTLTAGASLRLKVKVTLINGFKTPLVIRVSGLPAGVHAPEVSVPEKAGEVEIKLQAASNAPQGSGPIQVEVWTTGDAPMMQPAMGSLRGENQRGTSLLDSVSQLWLTVKSAQAN